MLNKKSVDDLNVKGRRVLVRCDFNVPLQNGEITDETRIVAALPTIKKLMNDGAKVILCSHLGKVKNGPNEGESLAPVAARLSEKLGKDVVFVADYNVTGEAATAAVAAMNEGDVVLLQNTRFRGKEETKNGEEFSKELADLADDYVCDAFGSSHRAHASVAGVTKFITEKGGSNAVGYLMQKEIDYLGNAVNNPVRPFAAILGGSKVSSKIAVINNLLDKVDILIIGGALSGLTAAITAKETDPDVDILIVDKAYASKGWAGKASRTAGLISYVDKTNDPEDFVKYCLNEIGFYLNEHTVIIPFSSLNKNGLDKVYEILDGFLAGDGEDEEL